jgi:hypothetical protein
MFKIGESWSRKIRKIESDVSSAVVAPVADPEIPPLAFS